MKRRIIILWLFLLGLVPVLEAQNWDYIRTSGEYYYGSGTGKTEAEADKAALNDLVQMIATHVSSDFQMQTDETQANGNIDHKTYVRNCVSTYSSSALTNVEKWTEGKEPEITVRRYMLRSELDKIYEKRKEKIRDMVAIADGGIGESQSGYGPAILLLGLLLGTFPATSHGSEG